MRGVRYRADKRMGLLQGSYKASLTPNPLVAIRRDMHPYGESVRCHFYRLAVSPGKIRSEKPTDYYQTDYS